mgnify:CR=1 FL=1
MYFTSSEVNLDFILPFTAHSLMYSAGLALNILVFPLMVCSLVALLDSGAETGFTYNYFLKHQSEFSQLRGTKEIVTGNVDGFQSTMAIHVPSVNMSICGHELNMKDVYVPYMKAKNENNDIVLGIDFFRKYNYVTLNFKDMFIVCE